MMISSPSASQGQYGLMAAVWLVLIAMFLGILSVSDRITEKAQNPASPLDALAAPVADGQTPITSAPIPVVFYESGSAALTEAGRDWLQLFAERAPGLYPGERLRLDILPASDAQDLTAARIATAAVLLSALGAAMNRIELASHAADAGASIRLAGGRE